MCGRYTLASSGEELQEEFDLESVPELPSRYNIAPSQDVPVITNRHPREIELFRWGLVPYWAKDVSIGYKMINARAESLGDKPAFKGAFARRRCLVVADGFYEWKKLARGKQPWHMRLPSKRPFAFAGLWEYWKSPEGEPLTSCTVVTRPATGAAASIHDRMPLVLPPKARSRWLSPESEDPAALTDFLRHLPPPNLEIHPVSRRVNSPEHEGPDLVEPVADA